MKPRNENTLKPREIAETLGVTTVSIRNYSREFAAFLSPYATNTTSRHFTPSDVQVLQVASSLLQKGYTYEQVRTMLAEQQVLEGEVYDGTPEPEPPGQEPPSAIQPLALFQTFVETLQEEHKSHIDTLKEENARLQAEIDWLRLPFFIRWFRKK